jgi:hypothetical protein
LGGSGRFDSNYLVLKVKHILGRSYTTELDLLARGSDANPRGEGATTRGSTPPPGQKPAGTGETVVPMDANNNPVK